MHNQCEVQSTMLTQYIGEGRQLQLNPFDVEVPVLILEIISDIY